MTEDVNRHFSSILVANRGEIACRVLKSARDLGYRTIAVHSEADEDAPHVHLADEAALIGPAPVGQSYLDIAKIIDAAARTGAEAIHPGYGFLSENAEFARACSHAGLVFIGPPPSAIELMGNKAAAKRRMIEAGVPCVPGYEGKAQDDEVLIEAAERIGYPVLVKASAGGGGRGMRLVRGAEELPQALGQARSEAESAFGSGELIIEKAIERPRHVEIQVFADVHGNVVHLGERDCSIQRRHQKVVEESPCPVMTAALRERMGAAAVEATRSISYRGAGTVEFLLDEGGDFYFLEMNTRLQVEHPVTEMVTGFDLVALQIAVAQGGQLPFGQDDVELTGHAIEVRLYAEDPAQDFMPSTGQIELWRTPSGEGIRVDDGIRTGLEVSPFYDAMVAKIVAWGESRETARLRLLRALNETALFGPASNRDFLIRILQQDAFITGSATTAFIEETGLADAESVKVPAFHRLSAAAVLDYRAACRRALAASTRVSSELLNWSSSAAHSSHFRIVCDQQEQILTVRSRGSKYLVGDDQSQCTVEVHDDDGTSAEISIDGTSHRVIYCNPVVGETFLSLEGSSERFINELSSRATGDESAGGGNVLASMHGQLMEVFVSEGETVASGQRLLILEAMKMQHEILANVDGIVKSVNALPGDQVVANQLILEIEAGGS